MSLGFYIYFSELNPIACSDSVPVLGVGERIAVPLSFTVFCTLWLITVESNSCQQSPFSTSSSLGKNTDHLWKHKHTHSCQSDLRQLFAVTSCSSLSELNPISQSSLSQLLSFCFLPYHSNLNTHANLRTIERIATQTHSHTHNSLFTR